MDALIFTVLTAGALWLVNEIVAAPELDDDETPLWDAYEAAQPRGDVDETFAEAHFHLWTQEMRNP